MNEELPYAHIEWICTHMLPCNRSLTQSQKHGFIPFWQSIGGSCHSGFALYFGVQRFDVCASVGCKTSALTDRRPYAIQQWHNELFLLLAYLWSNFNSFTKLLPWHVAWLKVTHGFTLFSWYMTSWKMYNLTDWSVLGFSCREMCYLIQPGLGPKYNPLADE